MYAGEVGSRATICFRFRHRCAVVQTRTEMKQLLAVSFIVLFYGVIAQTRPPLDTAVPIVRVSPSLRNNGSSASDSFGFAIVFYQLDPVVSTNISQWRLVSWYRKSELSPHPPPTHPPLSFKPCSQQNRGWSSQRDLPRRA